MRWLMEERRSLGRDEARGVMRAILAGEAAEVEIAALLGAMAARGETAEELAGFAEAMRAAAVPLPLKDSEREQLVDTCGTGGDACGTFNISTAAALVAAAAGATVAKHGNRAVTSQCGSADVLEAMGVPVTLSPAAAAEALRRHRFAFLLAPAMHPAMRAVMPVRRGLGVRTVFNVLGPLCNPAGAARQVMGVYAARLVPVVGQAMVLLGTRRAMVVHGRLGSGPETGGAARLGMDELSLSGPSDVAEVERGSVRLGVVTPEAAGLGRADVESLRGGDAVENAAVLRAIFAGERGPRRDVVLLNAAAVLVTAGIAADLPDGAVKAAEAIDRGAVAKLVEGLAETRG